MTRRRTSVDGVDISYVDEGSGPAVVVLHGFTGTGESMRPLIDALSPSHRVLAPDLVGHGASSAPETIEPYTTASMVGQLGGLIRDAEEETVSVVGYSLGGRLGLSFACDHPASVRSMVLIGTTAGLDDEVEREARRVGDAALAAGIEVDGVAAFVDRWERLPLFETQLALPVDRRAAIRAVRTAHTATGLANSLRGIGAGSMPPLWDRLDSITGPVRLVVGELDPRYRALAERLRTALPDAEVVVVDGVGHAVHVEAPEACAVLVAEAVR